MVLNLKVIQGLFTFQGVIYFIVIHKQLSSENLFVSISQKYDPLVFNPNLVWFKNITIPYPRAVTGSS